jgi:hypothetical protein
MGTIQAVRVGRQIAAVTKLGQGLALALSLLACRHSPRNSQAVAVPPPSVDLDAAIQDAALPDAAQTDSAVRGPTPNWPTTEQSIELAYRAAPVDAQLVLNPSPRQLDLHMNIDTTGSFGDEIDALQRELSRTIIPQLRARIDDASFGISRFADFPLAPFGAPGLPPRGDRPFQLLTPITNSLASVTHAVNNLDQPLGDGADAPEAGAEALYQVATGKGFVWNGQTLITPFTATAAVGGGSLGGVGFRNQALHVVVHATDAASHEPNDYASGGLVGTHSMDDAIAAMNTLHARVIGIVSLGGSYPRAELENLAIATGAVMTPTETGCPTGLNGKAMPVTADICPLVFDVAADGSGLANSIVDATVGLLDGVRFSEVHAEVGDDPLGFITNIALKPLAQPPGIPAPATADLLPSGAPDGKLDSYLNVQRLNLLGFTVSLNNQRIAPSDQPQHYRVSINVLGDGLLLEEHLLGVVVPSTSQQPTAADDAGNETK